MTNQKLHKESNGQTRPKLDITKLVLAAALICVATALMLYLYVKLVPGLIEKLEGMDKSMDNMIWFIDNLTLFCPMLAPILLLAALYKNERYYVPVSSQREQFWICLVTMAFTYLVMLPYVLLMSREKVGPDGGELVTLWDTTYRWFFMQFIPLVLMVAYHAVRADSEQRELEAPKAAAAEAPAEEDPA